LWPENSYSTKIGEKTILIRMKIVDLCATNVFEKWENVLKKSLNFGIGCLYEPCDCSNYSPAFKIGPTPGVIDFQSLIMYI
jgi:hypothetical protein